MKISCLALLVGSSVALRLTPRPPLSKCRPPPAVWPAVATALTALPTSTAYADDFWVELNKAPIELAPFKINPVGYTFILGYLAYVAWQINKPLSEGEKKFAEKRDAEAAEAAAAAGPFLQEASEEEGARVLPSGLVFRELTPPAAYCIFV